jgi:psp operon transcriptional activator
VYRLKDKKKQITRIAFDPFDSPFRLRETLQVTAEDPPVAKRPQVLPVNMSERVDAFERELLEAALERARFNQRVASDLLGLTYHQLRGKIRKHQLDVRRPA